MAGTAGPSTTTIVGREPELSRLSSLLVTTADDGPRAVLVEGDAGVGKTVLVEAAIRAAAESHPLVTLHAPCLPLDAISIPYLPLRTALGDGAAAGVDAPPPPDLDDAAAPVRLDAWLDGLDHAGPVVLFVDDLQWADTSTLDVLLYLVGAPRRAARRIVATVRSGEDPHGQRVRRWLADVRRMPGCTELRLGLLDRVATATQLAALLGAPPHESLVEDVYARSHGNPYFTRLLADGLAPDARHLPDAYSEDLRDAVVAAWYRLGPGDRAVAEGLAVVGAPAQPDALARVCGVPVDAVRAGLAEGVSAGLLASGAHGAAWFRHPLSAEVLERSLDDSRRHLLHGRCAALAAEAVAGGHRAGGDDVRDVVSLADHAYRAGDAAGAYAAALRAADVAGAGGGAAEQQRLLARALDLHPQQESPAESRRDLLERSRTAAKDAGLFDAELAAVDALLGAVDPVAEPLSVARLLVRRVHLEYSTGRDFMNVAVVREAVRLSEAQPRSGAHALALAELVHSGTWHGVEGLEPLAPRAIEIARAAGDDESLTYALTAAAMLAVFAADATAGIAYGGEAVEVAARVRNWWAYVHAVAWRLNAVEVGSSRTYAEGLRRYREQMVALGAPHTYSAVMSADEADSWLAVGDWRRAVDRLRDALAADPGPLADVKARIVAARLAALQGRPEEAAAHLARADERFAELGDFVAFQFDTVRAEVHLAGGDAERAYDAALRGLTREGPVPTMSEWLVPLALRALADLADAARTGRPGSRDAVARRGEAFEARFPRVVRDVGPSTPLGEAQVTALEALVAAEAARVRGADDGALWVVAAETSAAGELAWEEAYACRRGAEAFLAAGSRAPGVRLLRRGLAAAEALGAVPVSDALRDLAVRARVPLDEPAAAGEVDVPAGPVAGLTAREREVLALVAAGRTYAEIADALTISEKTVSTHVSHLLAKTGARNRVELSGLARRRP
ncbi:AAA family ATPase [Isoptericola sp. NPDC056573]|uniref:helix-turn-helix transcriptional regulator n=1 Tax=Isoptericola sp. NPDC056573 TaxID=3345868 RepID=UPI0036ACDB1F